MTAPIGPEHRNGCTIFYIMKDGQYQAVIRWPDGVLPAAGASWLDTFTDDLSRARYITTTHIDVELRDRAAFARRFIATAE